jgi:hypothetical protein
MKAAPELESKDNAFVRFVKLWVACALCFALVWFLSYHFFPEGLLRGKLPSGRLPVETSEVSTTFLRIFAFNLCISGGLIFISNLFRVGNTSMGFIVVIFHSVIYAVLLGTNSFGIQAPSRFAPSLEVVFNRSGAFEITAYIALVAATSNLTIWHQKSWRDWKGQRIASPRDWKLKITEILVIVSAILLLAAANLREANQIHQIHSWGYSYFGQIFIVSMGNWWGLRGTLMM